MAKSLLKRLPEIVANGCKETEHICDTPLIFSFFSGAGFLDLGFEKAGYEIGYVNEVHKPFLDAYKHSRRKMGTPQPTHGYFEGDIECCLSGEEAKRLSGLVNTAKKDKRLVGFIGGPPCPDFSVGGKNRGQHGENGKLSKIYVDLICKQQPDFFVFENVKGLYRTARHRQFFDGLKQQLDEAGYSCTERLPARAEFMNLCATPMRAGLHGTCMSATSAACHPAMPSATAAWPR